MTWGRGAWRASTTERSPFRLWYFEASTQQACQQQASSTSFAVAEFAWFAPSCQTEAGLHFTEWLLCQRASIGCVSVEVSSTGGSVAIGGGWEMYKEPGRLGVFFRSSLLQETHPITPTSLPN